MAHQALWRDYLQIPPITRIFTTACVVTTLAAHLDMVSPYQLYFNPNLIIKQAHLWRLITSFLYLGPFGFNFIFNLIFTYRYCRMLEEGSFRGRTADYLVMFLFGVCSMILLGYFVNLLFLGHALTIMLVYVWSRRNPHVTMNFFGLINFQAPYLPWVLLGFSVLLGNAVWFDLIGMVVGHMYYFMEDVFPNKQGGFRMLQTPRFLKILLDEAPPTDYTPLPEDRPGGFNWGEQPPPQQADQAQPPPPPPPNN